MICHQCNEPFKPVSVLQKYCGSHCKYVVANKRDRKYKREWSRKYRIENREKYNKRAAKYARLWRKKHPEKAKEIDRHKRYGWKYRERQIRKSRLHREKLFDYYVICNLRKRTGLNNQQISAEMIELERKRLILFRLIRKAKEVINVKTN